MKSHHAQVHNESIRGVELECHNCGDKYRVPPSREDGSRFCSDTCRYAWMRKSGCMRGSNSPRWDGGGIEVNCSNCNADLNRLQCRSDQEYYFCDADCLGEWQSRTRSGEDSPNWKGGYDVYYGPEWSEISEAVRNRDQHRCQDCGMSEREHINRYGRKNPVHHITPFRAFENGGDVDYAAANKRANLITLCDSCHRKWERIAPLRPDTTTAAAD